MKEIFEDPTIEVIMFSSKNDVETVNSHFVIFSTDPEESDE